MRIVVTGGAGFIGAHLVRALTGRREIDDVVVLDDLSTGKRANLGNGVPARFLEASILDREALDVACEGANAIVHLAARPSVPLSVRDPVASHAANVTGTVEVLEAARRHGNLHTIVASSSAVYGMDPPLPTHERVAPEPLSPYAANKLAAESYGLAYQACFGLPVLAFRFFNVYGPLQSASHAYAAVVPAFIEAALSGRPVTVHGDGKQTRDFAYVGTVTSVLADAVVRGVTSPGPVNLAFGTRHTVLDVIALLEAALGRELPVEHTDPRPGDVRYSQADYGRLRELFPDAEPVDLKQGLADTVSWFQAERG